ncbi:hypothetical protein GOV07_05970 [Candidatus Woesearchaeota archaeon]|nr:hypothetical protein [Candidatus Woesearchaeota archaeon]
MGLFGGGGPDRDDIIKQGLADAEAEAAGDGQKDTNEVKTGNDKVDIELTKVYAQLESFGEIRKANAERFSRSSEQLGEVRGMIVDTNKAMSKIEVASTKAVDLVESVHPEKLMIEVRKQDGKVEALRANIESNEAIMKDLMGEVKKMREQMNFYKGIEQVTSLNDEVKQELANIKKMEAIVERHADKVETIFIEVSKKFTKFDKFDSVVADIQTSSKRLLGDFEKFRVKLDSKENKKEFVTLVDKFSDFEKHTTNLLKLLDERSKTLKDELEGDFKKLKARLERKLKTGPIDLEAPEPGTTVPGTPSEEGEQGSEGADIAGKDIPQKGFIGKLKGFGKKVVDKHLDGTPEGEEKPSKEGQPEEQQANEGDQKAQDESIEVPVENVEVEVEAPPDDEQSQQEEESQPEEEPVREPPNPEEEKAAFDNLSRPPEGSAANEGKPDSEFAKDESNDEPKGEPEQTTKRVHKDGWL